MTTMNTIELEILGDPKAQMRSQTVKIRNLDFVATYDPSKNDKISFKMLDIVQKEARKLKGLITGAIRLDIVCYFPFRKGDYGTGKNNGVLKPSATVMKLTKPDRDNLSKFVMDALEGVFYANDSQIFSGGTLKLYSEKPKTVVWITPIDPIESMEDCYEIVHKFWEFVMKGEK